ncbi:hypothetical protein F4779DRAFT_619303 [Xylariaceae sp. FL0662B]|nr:hypothetical protein F4779DRAFT_619303 [Xylariaceae sp. FL0662B]
MCKIRRVYFSCGHEDTDVTPPGSILACENAVATGNYCPEESMGRTAHNAWYDAVRRDRPCIPCERRQIREQLDRQWRQFVRDMRADFAPPTGIAYYQEQRRRMIDSAYYLDWEMLQDRLIRHYQESSQAGI